MDIQQSAIYLAGNKRKLLPQILPYLLVEGAVAFIDVFGGSGTVSLNVRNTGHFNYAIYNERDEHIFGLQKYIQNNENDFCILQYLNGQYSRTKEDFLSLRRSYNSKPDYDKLFLLMCRSNSNMMRFNDSGKYNMTWGDRSPFYLDRVKDHQKSIRSVELTNRDFRGVFYDLEDFTGLDKVVMYLDPPYMNTLASYNEKGGWTKEDNTELLSYVKTAIDLGIKVVMSNVFKNRGKVHQQLIDWCEDNSDLIDVHHLDISYNNSSFRKSEEETDEVLIVSKEVL